MFFFNNRGARPSGWVKTFALSQKKEKAYLAVHGVNRVIDGQVHPGAL